DRLRNQILRGSLQNIFFIETVELQIGRYLRAELNQVAIEKRVTRFNRVCHRHAVAVIGDQVMAQPEFEIQIRPLVNRMAASQTFLVNYGKVNTVKLSKFLSYLRRVERPFYVSK